MSRDKKAAALHEAHKPTDETFKFPALGAEDLLIKVHSSPINPSDNLFIVGIYPTGKQLATIVGFEGSGLVLEASTREAAQAILGR